MGQFSKVLLAIDKSTQSTTDGSGLQTRLSTLYHILGTIGTMVSYTKMGSMPSDGSGLQIRLSTLYHILGTIGTMVSYTRMGSMPSFDEPPSIERPQIRV